MFGNKKKNLTNLTVEMTALELANLCSVVIFLFPSRYHLYVSSVWSAFSVDGYQMSHWVAVRFRCYHRRLTRSDHAMVVCRENLSKNCLTRLDHAIVVCQENRTKNYLTFCSFFYFFRFLTNNRNSQTKLVNQ